MTAQAQVVQAIPFRSVQPPAALLDHLREGQPHLFEAAMARAIGLSITETRRMVQDRVGARLAVACRAAGFDRNQFQEAFHLIQSSMVRMPSPGFCGADWATQVTALFDTIPANSTDQTLKRWRRATTTAPIPLSAGAIS